MSPACCTSNDAISPRLVVVRPGLEVVCSPKCRPIRQNALKIGQFEVMGLHFGGIGGCSALVDRCGAVESRARRGPGSWGPTGGVNPSMCSYTPLLAWWARPPPLAPATRPATQSLDKGKAPSGQGRDKP